MSTKINFPQCYSMHNKVFFNDFFSFCRTLNGLQFSKEYRDALKIPHPEEVNSSLSCGFSDEVKTAALVVCGEYMLGKALPVYI